MSHYLILNGPNLNLLGMREPSVYGRETYADLVAKIRAYAEKLGVTVSFFQSNHEGVLIDAIQAALGNTDGIVFNAGGYTHTSIALPDAIRAVRIPTVEVHISDINARESYRRISYLRDACIGSVIGHGTDGYCEAIDLLLAYQP